MQITTSCYAPGAEAVLQYVTHGVTRGVDLLQMHIWLGAHLGKNIHRPVSASWALPRKGRGDWMQATVIPLCKAFEAAAADFLYTQPYPCPGKLIWKSPMINPEMRALWLRNHTILSFEDRCKKLFGEKYPVVPIKGGLEVDNLNDVLKKYSVRQPNN